MTFWNDPARLFPKQSHRWVISFGQHDENNSSAAGGVVNANTTSRFFAKSVEKPSFDIKTTQVKYMHSHAFNFPQRVIWNPITITLYDVMKRRISYVNKTITTQIEVRTPPEGGVPKVYEVGMKESINEANNPLTTIIEDKNLGKDIINFLPDPVLNKNQLDPKKSNSVIDSYNFIDADKSTQLFFYRFLQESGYFIPEEMDKDDYLMRFRDFNFKNNMISSLVGKSSFEQENSLNYEDPLTKKKFIDTGLWNTINITELNENGFAIETWKLYNPLITSVKSDKLDYTNEGILNLTIGITYDWAKLIPAKTEINQIILKTDRRTERANREEKKTKQPEVDINLLSKKESVKKMLELKSTFAQGLKQGTIDKKYLEDIATRQNASALTKEAASSALEEFAFLNDRPAKVPDFTPQGLQNQPEANPQVPKVREVPSTSPEPKVSPSETTIINVTGPGSDPSITETRTIPLEGAGRGLNRGSDSVTSFSISANDPSLESNKNYSPSNDPLLREMFENLYPYQEPTPQPTPQQAPKQDATRRDAEVERALNRSEQAANLAELRGSG